MTEIEALVGLNLLSGIGSTRLKKLLEHFGNPQNVIRAPYKELIRLPYIGAEIAGQITNLRAEDIDKEFNLINKQDLDVISVYDSSYPESLKKIYDPPIVLYVKGSLSVEDDLSIAIVGSRRASLYGLNTAEKLGYELASLGITVVSGLAYGIDTRAHKGALKAGGRTIAVLGSGLSNIYPAENKKLAQDISDNGAVISEFPVTAQPRPHNFPRRNRIISGLSLGVAVVEAARNSGALITADFALEQGREVFALPGKIDAENSFGTNALIKDGAKLVSGIEDILEELNFGRFKPIEKQSNNKDSLGIQRRELISGLTDRESILYNTLSEVPLHLDELAQNLGLSIPQVLNILFSLEMRKLVRQLPGKNFIKN